ncbi:MAG: cytochrome P450 [Chloroflexi bacterium]|nr:cytochrome P450 [Chloroflexota bacterium]
MNRDERRQAFPIGAEIRMAGLSANPYPLFQRLHAEEPVTWVDEIEMWVVARRADVQAILADPETFTVLSPRSVLRRILGRNMLTTEGDEQHRLRNPFSHAFAPRTVRQTMVAPIAAQAETLVERMYARGHVCLVDQFSDRLALLVLGSMVGLPIEDYDVFRGWFHDFNTALGNFTGNPAAEERGLRAQDEFAAHVRAALNACRRAPDGSLISDLAARGVLSDEEIADSLRVIFFGGIETTSALLVNTVWALLQHPAAFDRVRAARTAESSN